MSFFSGLPKSFQAGLHGLITASNLVEGVRTTMRAAGCNASRSTFIAACFGAMVRCSSAVIHQNTKMHCKNKDDRKMAHIQSISKNITVYLYAMKILLS